MALVITVLYMIVNTACFGFNAYYAHRAYKDMDTHDMIWHLAWMLFFTILCTY